MRDGDSARRDLVQRASAHVARAIADAPLRTEPFEHLVIEEILPPELFESIMTAFPTPYPRGANDKPRSWIGPPGMLIESDGGDGGAFGVDGQGNDTALAWWRTHPAERRRRLQLFEAVDATRLYRALSRRFLARIQLASA